jgi:hypothetical protein
LQGLKICLEIHDRLEKCVQVSVLAQGLPQGLSSVCNLYWQLHLAIK